jgi:drug/metabolite transporter (DMT)-like permease
MLTLEASFTALLARILYKESMDRRVWMAMGFLVLGSVVLVLDAGAAGGVSAIGLAAVLLATAAWGVDNAISRGLAERDPGQVVLAKASLGTMLTASGAFLLREPLPSLGAAAALLAIGATGYGLSLRFYLLAQRAFGAARTGSVFAFAPFIGAGVAMAIGDRSTDLLTAFAGALMLTGVVLHLAESHAHEHAHEALEHEHAHGHDDGHHAHRHDPMPSGPHSHWHRHEPARHAHAHVPDAHHEHRH